MHHLKVRRLVVELGAIGDGGLAMATTAIKDRAAPASRDAGWTWIVPGMVGSFGCGKAPEYLRSCRAPAVT